MMKKLGVAVIVLGAVLTGNWYFRNNFKHPASVDGFAEKPVATPMVVTMPAKATPDSSSIDRETKAKAIFSKNFKNWFYTTSAAIDIDNNRVEIGVDVPKIMILPFDCNGRTVALFSVTDVVKADGDHLWEWAGSGGNYYFIVALGDDKQPVKTLFLGQMIEFDIPRSETRYCANIKIWIHGSEVGRVGYDYFQTKLIYQPAEDAYKREPLRKAK